MNDNALCYSYFVEGIVSPVRDTDTTIYKVTMMGTLALPPVLLNSRVVGKINLSNIEIHQPHGSRRL